MQLLGKLNDYVNAINLAAASKPVRYPSAALSVLQARVQYELGPRMHSAFQLYDVERSKWREYILDEQLRKILRRINPLGERQVVNDKVLFFQHCESHGLPTIPILASIEKQTERIRQDPASDHHASVFVEALTGPHDHLFFKPTRGTWGQHTFTARRENNVWRFLDRSGCPLELYRYCTNVDDGDLGWVVQPVTHSHECLQQISSPHALSTIRAITYLKDGDFGTLWAMMRIAVGKNITDNFTHGSTGNLIAPIDLPTGKLGICRGSSRTDWPKIEVFERHPDTGNMFSGVRVPHWQEALELLSRAHKSLPTLRTLAWDLAVTQDGPTLVEANGTYDITGMQIAQQQGLKTSLLSAID